MRRRRQRRARAGQDEPSRSRILVDGATHQIPAIWHSLPLIHDNGPGLPSDALRVCLQNAESIRVVEFEAGRGPLYRRRGLAGPPWTFQADGGQASDQFVKFAVDKRAASSPTWALSIASSGRPSCSDGLGYSFSRHENTIYRLRRIHFIGISPYNFSPHRNVAACRRNRDADSLLGEEGDGLYLDLGS